MAYLPCPYCKRKIPLSTYAEHFARQGGLVGGKSRSKAKQQASRLNGWKGGRPKKKP